MTLMCRSTYKDSKKSSFSIFRFFYNLLWFIEVSVDLYEKEKDKGKPSCIGDPAFSLKQILAKRSLCILFKWIKSFAVSPFPFALFMPVVPLLPEQSTAGSSQCQRKWWTLAVEKMWRSIRGLARIHGGAQHSWSLPAVTWPRAVARWQGGGQVQWRDDDEADWR
jgi:hypothetical protein